MNEKKHTNLQYEKELQNVKDNIIYMGALTERAIKESIKALVERDSDIAKAVIDNDHQIDQLDVDIEEKCIRLLALRQPAAVDLRFITTAIKINGHIERIGDLAANIAKKTIALNELPQLKPYIDIPRIAEIAITMIKESLEALVDKNVELANKVRQDDELIDNLNDQVFRELLTFMMEDPKTIQRANITIQIAKNLERISDHAKGIADMVIYLATGKSIRHV